MQIDLKNYMEFELSVNNFVVIESVYGKFIVNRHCDFQADALIKTGRTLLHSLRVLPDNQFGMGGLPRNARYAPQLVVAQQSFLREDADLMDFSSLPEYAGWGDSANTNGGS